MKNMVELAGLPIETVVLLATEVPARVAGVANRKGKLARRFDADVVIMNEKLEIEQVMVRGEELAR